MAVHRSIALVGIRSIRQGSLKLALDSTPTTAFATRQFMMSGQDDSISTHHFDGCIRQVNEFWEDLAVLSSGV